MYLVEVEFYNGYIIPYNTTAEYIKENYAIFRLKDEHDLQLFVEESEEREEVKRIIAYKYLYKYQYK